MPTTTLRLASDTSPVVLNFKLSFDEHSSMFIDSGGAFFGSGSFGLATISELNETQMAVIGATQNGIELL